MIPPLNKEAKRFYDPIAPPKIKQYVMRNLEASLSSIGFSKAFIHHLLTSLPDLDFDEFYRRYDAELARCYSKGFFQRIVPQYFEKNVIPHIPKTHSVLDIGCGTGILAHHLGKQARFQEIVGIDISKYPEWDIFSSKKIHFVEVQPKDFSGFLISQAFGSIVLTWSLHHMSRKEQEEYLKKVYASLPVGATVVILEDAYSTKKSPMFGRKKKEEFFSLSETDRRNIMAFYDWLANRVLAKRFAEPIPATYRTLEEWQRLCERIGFSTVTAKFIGFPQHRDINTPQSLLVLRKRAMKQ